MEIIKRNETVDTVKAEENGYQVRSVEGINFFVANKYLKGKEIKAGDNITLYCIYLSMIIGMDLNGEKLYLKTEEQLEQERLEELARAKQFKKELFEKGGKARQDETFLKLPKLLQHKLLMYRKFNVNFRYEQEYYEGGVMLAGWEVYQFCKSKEKVAEFRNMDFKEQIKRVSTVETLDSWHSYDCALAYAKLLAEDAEHMDLTDPQAEDLVNSGAMMLPNVLAPLSGHICYPRKEYIEKYVKTLSE